MALDFADAATSPKWVEVKNGGGPKYVGPDHSTLSGAKALAKRLEEFWARRGVAKSFVVFVAAKEAHATESVYGVREATSATPPRNKTMPFGREQHSAAMDQINKALRGHAVPVDVIFAASSRTRKVVAARRDCIRAVCAAGMFSSHYQVACFFNVTCSAVRHALRGSGLEDSSKGEKRGKGRRVCKRKMVRA